MDNEFSTNMAEAPKDETLVLLFPDPNDEETPYFLSVGTWDEEANRWDGAWRDFDETAELEPIAWGHAPDITSAVEAALEAYAAAQSQAA